MKGINYLVFLFCAVGYSQTVSINNAENSPSELVDLLLDNSCVQISNAAVSSEESVAYFNNNGGAFPISEGIVIRSGKAIYSQGSYTGENLGSQINSNTDSFLEEINNSSGQSANITDVAFFEFDFVPLSSDLNFNFLFASNEYGEWQCVSSDIFAFLLTDLSTGETTNLAVIPNTQTPVSVRNIKDNDYNSSCGSSNPQYFASYQAGNPATSTVNMRGFTEIMTASAQITPGNSYRIKLVIGDSNDADYDSAIFLSAGSFTANVDLGEDQVLCGGDEVTIGTGLDASLYSHTWTLNGQTIANEQGNFISANEVGTYAVQITQNDNTCLLTDEIIVAEMQVQNPANITVCYNDEENYTFDLTANNASALGLNNNFTVKYYASYEDVLAENPISQTLEHQYPGDANQTVFIKIFNPNTGNFCGSEYSFNLLVEDSINISAPGSIEICTAPPSDPIIDLTQVEDQILQGQVLGNFQLSYFNSLEDAQNNETLIANPTAYTIPLSISTETIWVRVQSSSFSECYETVSFEINLNTPPVVDTLPNAVECSSYILPQITNGNYYTGPQGSGMSLDAGDEITDSGTIYIFNGPDVNGCSSESSFTVSLIEEYSIGSEYCGVFVVPGNIFGHFYTASGGPSGEGELIPAGTAITSSQTVHFFAEMDDVLCRDDAFEINILPLPEVDEPSNVITCNSYILPALSNGNYFTQPNGGGVQLNAGAVINSSRNLYVFNDDGVCTNENIFHITIVPAFEDIDACGSYTLPQVEVGSYFTQAFGEGEQLPAGTAISSSQTIYYYTETTTFPNCTENISFNININAIPEVDELPDVVFCESEGFILPNLSNGQYFTEPNRNGVQLFPGNIISQTTDIYINNLDNGCSNKSVFQVEIRPLPIVEDFTDVYTCYSYELPVLAHGTYYTQPGGTGEILNGGDVITTTRTIFIYNEWSDLETCSNEDSFKVYIEGVELADFQDIEACDSYMLPVIPKGNYFTESGGEGSALFAGDVVTESQEIFIYVKRGTRFICEDEISFNVNISHTPNLTIYEDVESCGSYTLPVLSQENFNLTYYWSPGGVNEISPSEFNISSPGTYNIYVQASAQNNVQCTNETQFQLVVYPLLELDIEGGVICKDPSTGEIDSPAFLTSGLDASEFQVEWYLNNNLIHTGVDFEATQPGEYTVITNKLIPEIGSECNYKPTSVLVSLSGKPVIKASVTEPFTNIAVIDVEIINGFGEYEFQLNGGDFQEDGKFYDVASGSHELLVRGKNGNCGGTVIIVEVLKFPKFFTPNNDGFNDRWNIWDLSDHPEAKIELYDRYGKLLKILNTSGEGWDGTFHGKSLPSNDYWFKVIYEIDGVPKQFKSHFTLKR